MSVDLNLPVIETQSRLRSLIMRMIHGEIQTAVNDLQNQINIMVTPPTGSEVTDARDYHTVLRDRLRSASKPLGPVLVSGGVVSQQGTPNMTVAVSAGEAIINGVAVKWSAVNSGTITAPTYTRYGVVLVASDSTVSVIFGTDSPDPTLPSVTSTQRALALITLTAGMTSITNAIIRDIREQGCWIDGRWFWTIQEAVTYTQSGRDMAPPGGRIGGRIIVNPGHYYEQVIIQKVNGTDRNLDLILDPDAHLYRLSSIHKCIWIFGSVAVAGNWVRNVNIFGGYLHGNGKAGDESLIHLQYVNKIRLEHINTDGNTLSTGHSIGYGRDLYLIYCLGVHISNNLLLDRFWDGVTGSNAVAWDYGPSNPENYNVNSYHHDAGETPIGGVIFYRSMAGCPPSNPFGIPYGYERAGNSPLETVSDYGSPIRGAIKPYIADPNWPAEMTLVRVK